MRDFTTDESVAEGHRLYRQMLAKREAKRLAREATAALYAEQVAKHVEHPQSRGAKRRMLSKP